MKTLDQIWQENFDILPPGTYQGSDCGNQIGGGAEPNQKPPLETLTDKFKEILQDPALSDAAKQAKLQQIIDDFGKPSGKDPYGSPLIQVDQAFITKSLLEDIDQKNQALILLVVQLIILTYLTLKFQKLILVEK
jgi:hypothetical protein